MAFDLHKNFAYSTVATAPSPATSGTTLIVQAGAGASFPTPPFNAVVWPAGAQPLSTNSEIVRVTGISTDTLTIVRGATSGGGLNGEPNNQNRSIIIGDQIDAGLTVRSMTDIENDLYSAYKFSYYRNTAFSGSSGTNLITCDTSEFDTGSNYSTSTGKFTAPIAGFYEFSGAINAAVNNGGWSQTLLYKNGTAVKAGSALEAFIASSQQAIATTVDAMLSLASSDYVQLYWVTNGVSIYTGPANTWFQGHIYSQT